jgi:hypothetical protein
VALQIVAVCLKCETIFGNKQFTEIISERLCLKRALRGKVWPRKEDEKKLDIRRQISIKVKLCVLQSFL